MRVLPVAYLAITIVLLGLSSLRADDQGMRPAAASAVVVKPVSSSDVTSSGQPIVMPRGHLQVTSSTYDIAPGAVLPIHKHPFPRYGYVLVGTLEVTNDDTGRTETFKPGDFIVEAVDQWHHAVNKGMEPVKLLVIDMTKKGKANVVMKK